MNERIQELAKQATRQYSPTYYTQEWIQGFAQLIIRECADVAKQWTPETEECEYTWLIHDKIKEHFGVEV